MVLSGEGQVLLSGLLAVAAQRGLELLWRERIEHLRRFDPAAPGRGDAEAHDGEVFGGVRVRVYQQLHAQRLGTTRVGVFQVEAVGEGINLHGDAELGRGAEEGLHVDRVSLAPADETAGGVGDGVHPGVPHGGHDSLGLRGLVHLPAGMHGGNDEVELLKDLVRVVQRAVASDVHFDAIEKGQPAYCALRASAICLARAGSCEIGRPLAMVWEGE